MNNNERFVVEELVRISDVVGITGVIIILVAYYLLSAHKVTAHSFKYHMFNCIGAWMILFSLYFHWNTASVVIELSWISISVMGMYRCYKAKQLEKHKSNSNVVELNPLKRHLH